jgi:HlyD family secretion protein
MNTNNGTKLADSPNGVGRHRFPNLTLIDRLREIAYPLPSPEVRKSTFVGTRRFDQPVILQQSPIWSRAIVWVLMGVSTTALIWACVAKIEEAIPAQGKLEPQGTVNEVQVPVGGVVKAIYVNDGQRVRRGERLLSLDPTAAKAQLTSLQKVRTVLSQENQFYRTQMSGSPSKAALEQAMAQRGLPLELVSLTKSRAALAAENQIYRAQLGGLAQGSRLKSEQRERLQSSQAELNSRVTAAELEVEQSIRQLSQTQIQLASAKDTLAMNQEILNNITPLVKVGALSRIQHLKQRQQVRTSLAEAAQLAQEQERLKLAINEAKSKLQNTIALSRKELLTQMADNNKRIAEIDSQLAKAMVENNKRIAEIDSQLSQTQLTLQYQELRAPSDGTVFDLQPHNPGFVASSNASVLKIVPDDALTAKVFITTQDIGFVKEGMKVDVRLDSFPFSEFGDVKGKLVWIGADALPPDKIHDFYRFPAKVHLERQSLLINGREVPLQSGMAVSANIKLRTRTVMSIFTDLFSKNIESLKFVR